MKVYIAPNELLGTLEKDVADIAVPLPGLEERTGADALLSISPLPLNEDSVEDIWRIHTQTGLLVQLKRYGDLPASITDESRLFRSILKMREWTSRPWLVVTGHLFEVNGKAVVAKAERPKLMANQMAKVTLTGRSSISFASLDGAMDAFRYYGGYAKFLPEGQLLGWFQRQAKKLDLIQSGTVTELAPRSAQRELKSAGRIAWLAALFDGIGHKTSEAIWTRLEELFAEAGHNREPRLIDGMAYVTDYLAAEISGINEDTIRRWRAKIGLDDGPKTYTTIGVQYRDLLTRKLLLTVLRHDPEYVVQKGDLHD